MAKVKLPKQPCTWQFGVLKKFLTTSRYQKLYNFDVHFSTAKGPVGMMLEASGRATEYNAEAKEDAIEGTWFFLNRA